MKRIVIIPLVLGWLSGCETLNQEECINADWQTIGYEDGVRGKAQGVIRDHRKACAQYGVSLDLDEYRSGYDKGLPVYCTAQNGFRLANQGETYQGVCPEILAVDFLEGYDLGRELYEMRSDLEGLHQALADREKQAKRAKYKAREIKARLIEDDLSSAEKAAFLDELEDWQSRHGALKHDIRALEIEIALVDAAYHDLESHLP